MKTREGGAAVDDLYKEPNKPGSARQVTIALRLYVCVMASFLVLSWAVYILYPTFDRRPLFTKSDQFMDLKNYIGKTAHLLHSSAALGKGLPVFSYSPPAAFLWHALLIFPRHPLCPYMVLVALAVLGFATLGILACRSSGRPGVASVEAIGATALLGWPLWFAVDRANLEGLVWAVTGAGVCFFLRERYRAAAVCIGLAACIKPFPFAFCVLLILRRKYWDTALAATITAVLVLAAFIGIGPNPWKAYQDLKPGVAIYTRVYIQTIRPVEEIRFAHSILDEAKFAAAVLKTGSLEPTALNDRVAQLGSVEAGRRSIRLAAAIYPFVALVAFGGLVLCARRMPALNQVTLIALGATLLPPNSGEYTLLNLYVPFGALVVFLARDVATDRVTLSRGRLFGIVSIYGLLFAPLTFLRIYSGFTKLLLLLMLLTLFVGTPMPTAYFGDKAEVGLGRERAAV